MAFQWNPWLHTSSIYGLIVTKIDKVIIELVFHVTPYLTKLDINSITVNKVKGSRRGFKIANPAHDKDREFNKSWIGQQEEAINDDKIGKSEGSCFDFNSSSVFNDFLFMM